MASMIAASGARQIGSRGLTRAPAQVFRLESGGRANPLSIKERQRLHDRLPYRRLSPAQQFAFAPSGGQLVSPPPQRRRNQRYSSHRNRVRGPD